MSDGPPDEPFVRYQELARRLRGAPMRVEPPSDVPAPATDPEPHFIDSWIERVGGQWPVPPAPVLPGISPSQGIAIPDAIPTDTFQQVLSAWVAAMMVAPVCFREFPAPDEDDPDEAGSVTDRLQSQGRLRLRQLFHEIRPLLAGEAKTHRTSHGDEISALLRRWWRGLVIAPGALPGGGIWIPRSPVNLAVPLPADEVDQARLRRACALSAVVWATLAALQWHRTKVDAGEPRCAETAVQVVIFAAHVVDAGTAPWSRITERQQEWLRDWWSRVQRRLSFRGALMPRTFE